MKKAFHYFPQFLIIITFIYSLTHLNQINQITETTLLAVQKLFFSLYFLMLLFSIANECHLFIFLSQVLKKPMEQLLHLNYVESSIYLASIFSGYPTFAKLIKEAYLNKSISLKSADHLLKICSHASIGFIVLGLGPTLYGNLELGWLVFFTQVLSNFILALFTRKKETAKPMPIIKNNRPMMTIVQSQMKSCLVVFIYIYGFMLVFNILASIFFTKYPLIHGLLEFSQGCLKLQAFPLFYRLIFSSGMIAFSSFSVILQVSSLLDNLSFDLAGYIRYRIYQGFISMILTTIFYIILY